MNLPRPSPEQPLRALAALFLRVGSTAFGGPAAHMAIMEDEVVRQRGWLSREAFLDLVGASQLIPGPNSTELALHVGYARAGWRGLLVAGTCFIAPAMAIVWLIAWGYVTYGTLPEMAGLLAGVKPVVLAVVTQALWGFARTALSSAMTLAVAVVAGVALLLGVHEFIVLAAAAAVTLLDARVTRGGNPWERPPMALAPPVAPPVAPPFTPPLAITVASSPAALAVSLGKLFLVFLKAGGLLFGSGYVLIAFLRTDLVVRLGWLTESQLLDAIAVGQFTPGPVFTTATFVGYLLAGNSGALVATLGIFLPAFVFVALTAPVLARLRHDPVLRAALSGLNAASLALMAVVCVPLAAQAFARPMLAVPLFLASFVALVHWRANSAWLVIAGASIGLLAD
ncbi:MAG: chromate efflux transporter [Gemmatimonadetes bacterium]|nr:chromate efflux transporter [Gemmatimonadota bacterium]